MHSHVHLDRGDLKFSRRQRLIAVAEEDNAPLVQFSKRRRGKAKHRIGWPFPSVVKQQTMFRRKKRVALGKFGMKRFEAYQPVMKQCRLKMYMDRHLSPHDDLFPITGCGDSRMVVEWFQQLTPSIKEKVRKSGFEDLIRSLQPSVIDGPLMQALATKWWDTTHTFHFPHIGELTMTPKDFSAITGLCVSGIPLFIKHGIYRDKKLLHQLLGEAICMWNKKRVPVLWLYETYTKIACVCEADEDIVARAFILALLGATIFATPSMEVDLDWLGLMLDVSTIGRYNWGASALAFLYNHMDDISRKNTVNCGGLWQAWEVWSREYFNIFPLIMPTTTDRIFPASKKWNLVQKPDEDPTIRLEYYTIKLENILLNNINWNPWGNYSILPWYVAVSIDASKKRILLIRPNGSAWYLAERVLIQSFGVVGNYVPRDPPLSMLQPQSLSVRRSRISVIGQCAHSFITTELKGGEAYTMLNAGLADRYTVDQLRNNYMDATEVGEVVYPPNDGVKTNAATLLLGGRNEVADTKDFDLQTLHFPTHVKQVPVATASKLLHVIGGLQILLTQALKNADDKLRETAFTIEEIRDELGLHMTPGSAAAGNYTNEDSSTFM